MASGDIPASPTWTGAAPRAGSRSAARTSVLATTLGALASLRLTVTLFALSIFLVFMGTLAQVDHDVWYVVEEGYFRVWFAWIELQAFVRLFEMFSTEAWPAASGGFWFPGGWTIGALLAVNLIAAHSVRFKVSAKGARLAWGLATIALGIAATTLVINSGMDNAIESELSSEFCSALWHSLRGGLVLLALAGGYWVVTRRGRVRNAEWWVATLAVAAVAAVAAWLLLNPGVRLNDSGLRILWQLIKGGAAAAVLLAGCVLAFRKRAGVVLLHGGVGLLMFSELLTGLYAQEAQMVIREGESSSFVYDMRDAELAITDRSGQDADRVTVIPEDVLRQAAESGATLSPADLPFDVRVVSYFENSDLRQPDDAANPATRGEGLAVVGRPVAEATGTGKRATNDIPSAYVQILDRDSGEPLGTWLVSTWGDEWFTVHPWSHGATGAGQRAPFLDWFAARAKGLGDQTLEHEDEPYSLALRFERTYKDYTVALNDFAFDRYVGTNTPKNYSSAVTLTDPARGVDRAFDISMNNPLRYAGDTLYQSGFDEVTEDATVLQVVANESWMIPYVSCMLVGVGMLAHFGVTLGRFLRRRAEEAARRPAEASSGGIRWSSPTVYVPVIAACVFAAYALSKTRPAEAPASAMPIHRFGALAMAEGGRVKPYDTYARTTLQYLSGRQEVDTNPLPPFAGMMAKLRHAFDKDAKIPAIQWMLDTVTGKPAAADYRVFRVENPDVLQTLDLEPRPGSYRYSQNEISQRREELEEQFAQAAQVPEEERSLYQRKLGELRGKMIQHQMMVMAFTASRINQDLDQLTEGNLAAVQEMAGRLRGMQAARPVPPASADGEWRTLVGAEFFDIIARAQRREPNPATGALIAALDAYASGDQAAFTDAVDTLEGRLAIYEKQIDSPANAEAVAGMAAAERLSVAKTRFEQWFSQFSPFTVSAAMYLSAFVFAAVSWLVAPKTLGRVATAIVVVTLLFHTFALVGRIYISGRPPVTNLYSSAVFIGWATVVFGLVLEAVYRMGVGTIVGSVVGFLTLIIAYHLSLDGDTFTVMQAVLDTQFWLATHVVCITLGYATTFLAGFLGIVYLLGAHVAGRITGDGARALARMIYGTLCFAIFFSFIGTVLGGLWADDSWGRFWGWDPKENGALIIVIWNALVLHARWGGLVAARGLAALAIVGNVVTTWSWFGVNELGVGLHAYGGVSDEMSLGMLVITTVLLTHPPLIALALLRQDAWAQLIPRASPA